MTNDSETSNEDTNNLKRLYESGKVELWRTINYARISKNAGLDGYLFTHIRPTKKPVKQDILGLLIDGMTFIIPNNWILYKEKEKEDTYDAEEGQAHEEATSGNSDIEILFDEETKRRYFYNNTTEETDWLDDEPSNDDADIEILFDEKTKRRYSYNNTTEETDWLDDELAGEDTAVAAAEDDVEDTTPIDNRDKSKKNWKKISKAVVTDKELPKSWITISSRGLYNRAFVSSSGKEFVEITKAELSSEDLVHKTIYKKAKDISSIVTLLKEQREHQGGSVTCCKKDCQYNREQGSFFCLNHSINSILDNKKQSHDFIFN